MISSIVSLVNSSSIHCEYLIVIIPRGGLPSSCWPVCWRVNGRDNQPLHAKACKQATNQATNHPTLPMTMPRSWTIVLNVLTCHTVLAKNTTTHDEGKKTTAIWHLLELIELYKRISTRKSCQKGASNHIQLKIWGCLFWTLELQILVSGLHL